MTASPEERTRRTGGHASSRSAAGTGLSALAILLLVGLLLRLTIAYVLLPGSGFGSDIGTFTAWAQQLARSGPGDFYATASFADYPPGYLYVLWLVGGLGNLLGGLTGQGDITAALIKLPPMLADIGIGYLLYRLVRDWRMPRVDAERLGLMAAAIYVFNPVSWYDSAIWGQADAIGALVLLLAVMALLRGNTEGSVALTVLAGIIKPQFGVVLAPLVVAVLLRRHLIRPGSSPRHEVLVPVRLRAWFTQEHGPWRLLSALTAGLVTAVVLLTPFSLDIPGFVSRMVETAGGYPYLSVNAYNGWALVGSGGQQPLAFGGGWSDDTTGLLGPLPGVVIGAALLVVGYALAMWRAAWLDDRRGIVVVAIFLALAFFILPTRVHERYMFPIFALLPIVAVVDRRWLWATVAFSAAGLINLHGILTTPLYGTDNVTSLPLGDLFRSPAGVLAAAALSLGGFAFVCWQLRPSAATEAVLSEQPPAPAATLRTNGRARVTAPVAEQGWLAWLEQGLAVVSLRRDRSAELVAEPGGRLDRLDLVLLLLVFLSTLTLRGYRVDEPRAMYFDEVYHARTAMEFLQDWRYGMPHSIYEWTHPHLAKYAMALGIEAFGDNQVTSTRDLGAPVVAAAIEPRWGSDPNGSYGDRLYVASSAALFVYDLGSWREIAQLPGAYTALAVDEDSHVLYLCAADGTVSVLATSVFDAGADGSDVPTPVALARLDGLAGAASALAPANDRLIVVSTGGTVVSLDTQTGTEGGRVQLPGAAAPVGVTTDDGVDAVVVGGAAGMSVLDATSLASLHEYPTSAPVTGMALVRRGVDKPTIYAAVGSSLQLLTVADDGTSLGTNLPMPGPITAVYWNSATWLVHVLGTSQDGSSPTVYVVDTHGNSVFADARLPFVPAAVAMDVQPLRPAADREDLLAFDGGGHVATVDVGGNSFGWRFPGVLVAALMAVCIYLLARFLFSRRSVALIAWALVLAEGMLFANARIGMNDTYVAFFIVAALTIFVPLWLGRWRSPLAALGGLPLVGVLLGLALASKWVGAYAIGAVVLLILLRSSIGRLVALVGMIGMTALLGYLAINQDAPSVEQPHQLWPFLLLMLGLTVLLAIAITLRPVLDRPRQAWLEPRRWLGLPFVLVLVILVALPLVVYTASYIPWVELGNRWTADFPAGHSGQTFLDLQRSMYSYHNELHVAHAASSPWWAWPLDLKPVWFQQDDYAASALSEIYDTGNIVIFWLAIPAVGWLSWQAWRRRSLPLAFIVLAILAMWLPWARINRATFQYHFLTVVPFTVLALAYFLAELWHGPSARTWLLARLSAAGAIVLPAVLWLLRLPLCGLAGTESVNPGTEVCGALSRSLTLTDLQTGGLLLALAGLTVLGVLLYTGVRPGGVGDQRGWLVPVAIGTTLLGLVIVLLGAALPGNPVVALTIAAEQPALVALLLLIVPAWFVLRARDPRNYVVSALIAAGCWFVLFYPNFGGLPVPRPLAQVHLGLLPTWNYGFQFGVNTNQPNTSPVDMLTVALLALAVTILVASTVYAVRVWQATRAREEPEGPAR
jgi:hypothetical protein